MAKLVRSYL